MSKKLFYATMAVFEAFKGNLKHNIEKKKLRLFVFSNAMKALTLFKLFFFVFVGLITTFRSKYNGTNYGNQ
jgi:hypothetical protein